MVKCTICDCKATPNAPIFRFPQLLREVGFEGQFAHTACLQMEQKAARVYKMKYGVEREDGTRL